MSKTKKALISVFYKDGILDFARYLAGNGWEILSTGGTKKHLQENGVPVTDENGEATFFCNGGSVSVWVIEEVI